MSVVLGWFRYQLERWVLRGSLALVLLLVALLSLVAMSGAAIAYFLPGHHFATFGAALWWAILRISDPGYLSDDFPDVPTRSLSVVLSVMGMAVTVGGVVAIVTQSMNRALRALAAATTPVPFSDHVVVVGLTDRTPTILNVLLSDQADKIVLLVAEVTEEATRIVNQAASKTATRSRIVLRSGQSQRAEELARAGCQRAKMIIFPATTRAVAGDPQAGPRLLKSLAALSSILADREPNELPMVVVELVDRTLTAVVRATFPEALVLASDRVVARTLRLALQGPGMAAFAFEVAIPRAGRELTVSADHGLEEGLPLWRAEARIAGAQLLGIVGDKVPLRLDLGWDTKIARGDRLLTFGPGAPSFSQQPLRPEVSEEEARRAKTHIDFVPRTQRILVLGWNEVAPDLILELLQEPAGRYEVDFLSTVPTEERERDLLEVDPDCLLATRHFEGEPMTVGETNIVSLEHYSRFLILADRRVLPEAADERTLAVVLALSHHKSEFPEDSCVALELLSDENRFVTRGMETVVTPLLAANLLCTLALHSKADQALAMALSHQATFFSRVVAVPGALARNLPQLAAAIRAAGYALLTLLPETPGSTNRQVVICETAIRHRTPSGDGLGGSQ